MTTIRSPEVLVFPRGILGSVFSLLPWDSVQPYIEEIERSFSWLYRPEAEQSHDMVQAIPCVLIRDPQNRYCVFRRVKDNRPDLSKKLSLIIGGHIDEGTDNTGFLSTMSCNLIREIEEETGIRPESPPHPVGLIVDGSSILASRHVGFVHEIIAEHVSSRAPEEFTNRSKYTGEFMLRSQLSDWRDEFDPWSRLIIEEYISPTNLHPRPRQGSFL